MWSTGQDQSRALKQLLQEVLPGIHCFLDVDDLHDISRLEEYIEASQTVVVFVSRGYFQSRNCMKELVSSVKQEKRIIFVCEAEVEKGSVSLTDEVAMVAKSLRVHLEVPMAAAIMWQRARPFLEVALLELSRMIVENTEAKASTSKHDPLVLLGGVLDKQQLTIPLARAGARHLYTSVHNLGAREFVEGELITNLDCFKQNPLLAKFGLADSADVDSRRHNLREKAVNALEAVTGLDLDQDGDVGVECSAADASSVPQRRRRRWWHSLRCARRERAQSSVFLLYLDNRTWSKEDKRGVRRAALAKDVCLAMERQMRVLLLHECAEPQRLTSFGKILDETPAELVEWGLYGEIAVALQPGIYRPVSLHLSAGEMVRMLLQEPKVWEGARLAGGAIGGLEVAGEAMEGEEWEEKEFGEETAVEVAELTDAATTSASQLKMLATLTSFLQDGTFLHGVDDTSEMVVNPVHLQRMQHRQRTAVRQREMQEGRVGSRAGSWLRLGINVVAVDERGKQLEQLKKLERFLAKDGVNVASSDGSRAAHDSDKHAEAKSSDCVLRTSSTYC